MALRRRKGGRNRYSATAGLHFDDEEFESELVWIWTMARSGSTWFLKMLAHPLKLVDSSNDPDDRLGFVVPQYWQGTVDAIPVDTTFIANHLLPLAGKSHYLEDGTPVTFSTALGLNQRGNYFFSPKYEDSWIPELRRMMLVRFHRLVERTAEVHDTSNPRVLLKEVAGAHAAPLVMSMFPRSKMIFLIRDGRDVVDSQTAANRPGGWLPVSGWSTDEERLEFVRLRARDWVGDVSSIERAYDAHPAELRRMVRYEDLLADATGAIGPLVEWLGLKRGATWLERSVEVNAFSAISAKQKGQDRFFRSASPGAWRKNLTAEEAAALERITGPKLRELGYQVDTPPDGWGEDRPGGDGPGGGSDGPLGGNGGTPTDVVVQAQGDVDPLGEDEPEVQGGPTDVLSATVQNNGRGRDFTGLGKLISRRGGPTGRRARKVALTFDDGPTLQTYNVLQTLEGFGVRGTFFLVGRKVPGHERLVNRLLDSGHEVGNHSFAHTPYPEIEDVNVGSAVLEHVTGTPPRLFRPPFGAIDRPGAEAAIDGAMKVILWNVDSDDGVPPWKGISSDQIISNVMERVRPASIVLMHDSLFWSRSAEALPTLIERLRDEDYELVTVSELLTEDGEGRASRRRPFPRLRLSRPERSRPAATERDAEWSPSLSEVLDWVSAGLQPPSGPSSAAALLSRACAELRSKRTGESELLARHLVAHENNVIRPIALGFCLRVPEVDEGRAAGPTEELVAELREAEHPETEVATLARKLASPTRVDRLVMARVAEQEAGGATAVDPDAYGATDEFLELFAPGSEVWHEIQRWTRNANYEVGCIRTRELTDAAGVDPDFDIEAVIERTDTDYFLRFGYVLAVCGEILAPTHA